MSIRAFFILYLFLGVSGHLLGQRSTADTLRIGNDQLIVHPILHGTLMLEYKDLKVLVDPYGGKAALIDLSPDLVLITDIHGDHLNESSLEAVIRKNMTIIAPQAVKDKISAGFKDQVLVINNGENQSFDKIEILAIPMYNLPESTDSRHVKGRGNGYLLTMGEARVYISGDTEDIPEMRALQNIDLAFVCMNLPYTMDINQAASAVLEFKPSLVYPYHYRGKPGLSDIAEFKKRVNDKNPEIVVRLRNWYPEY